MAKILSTSFQSGETIAFPPSSSSKVAFTIILTAAIASCSPQRPSEPSIDNPVSDLSNPVTSQAANRLSAKSGEWAAYGSNIGNTKYAPLEEINATNIDQIEIAWRRPALNPQYLELNPNQRFSSNYVAAAVVRGASVIFQTQLG